MTMRITITHLRPIVARLNTLAGTPADPYTKGGDGKPRANIGNFHLSGAYGGWSLHRMVNEVGGVSDVFGVGYVPARTLYDLIHAYMRGIEYARSEQPAGEAEDCAGVPMIDGEPV